MTNPRREQLSAAADPRPTILHAKFQAWLSWSQPFMHDLVAGLEAEFRGVVVCSRVENLHRFPHPRLERVPSRVLARPSHAALQAAALAHRWQPRVLHAHFGWSAMHILLLRHFLGIPMLTTFGGRDIATQSNLEAMRPVYDLVLAHSDRIVCVSESLRQIAIARGADPDRTCVIRRGTNLARFAFVDRSDRSADAPLRVLSVGRLVPKKGHRDAVEAIARLASDGVAVTLRIVGEGEEEGSVRSRARELGVADRIAFLRPRVRDDICTELAAADVLLHPSTLGEDGDVEGLPNAVVEAAATGLPVVATRHGGIPEAVVDGETGRLVDERDAAGLAAALATMARAPADRLRLGKNAATRARDVFDGGRQVAAYGELYRELMELHPPGSRGLRRSSQLEALPEQLSASALPGSLEFSLSEWFDTHLAPSDWAQRGWPRAIESGYGLRRHVPGALKSPAKRWLGAMLGGPDAAEPLADRERAIVHGFGRSMDLNEIDPAWTPEELRRAFERRVHAGAPRA